MKNFHFVKNAILKNKHESINIKKSPTAATDYMYQLFVLSLQDLGYYTSNINNADIIISTIKINE